MRAGWRKGRPVSSASSATGGLRSLRPRSRGRSGWEITSPTSWSEAMRPRKMVAAKSGVPANASFMSFCYGSPVRLLMGHEALSELTQGVLTRLAIRAVQDQDTVEVIYLVLEDTGKQAFNLDPHGHTRQGLSRDRYGVRTLHLDPDLRQGEATLHVLLRILRSLLDNRVRDHELLIIARGDEDAFEVAYLVRCEAHAFVFAHDPHHPLCQLL